VALPASVHRFARRRGIDLTQLRYADSTWAARMRLLETLGPDAVLDIGANVGQFASELRLAGYGGPIVSFEPLSDAYKILHERSVSDPSWIALPWALGSRVESASINVSANSMSSSLLPMSEGHEHAAPDSTYVRTEHVQVRRMDDIAELAGYQRMFCKIDTQGFEQEVLSGIGDLWPRIIAVQLETSHVPLYDGSWLNHDVVRYFEDLGWEPVFVERGFTDARTGRVLQSDWIFAPAKLLA
jgi:FkbM family methyltransferase